jgi:hypothetical protein
MTTRTVYCSVCLTPIERELKHINAAKRKGRGLCCSKACASLVQWQGYAKGVIEHLDLNIQPGIYRTRSGITAIVEGRDRDIIWPIYGRIEWWERGSNRQWRKQTRRERWRPDGGWGETHEPFELDLVVGQEVAA